MKIFTDDFEKINHETILDEISTNGYFSFSKALTSEFLDKIEQDSTQHKININDNLISGVYLNRQYYFVNLLAKSREFYDYLTSDLVRNVCFKYFNNKFRLKALRYYETYGGHHMQWHTDNKIDRDFAEIPGLIFIFYVTDVNDGEFQYIKGSHKWSEHSAYNIFTDKYVEERHKNEIESFKMPKGSLIIYNTYGIHRAKPVKNKSFSRKSVFIQIDGDITNGEPIYLNPKIHYKKDEWIDTLLGFGLNSDNKEYPGTNAKTIPPWLAFKTAIRLLLYIPRTILLSLLSNQQKNKIKKFLKFNKG